MRKKLLAGWVLGVFLTGMTVTANAAPVGLNANFRLFGEVNRFSFLGFGDMTVNFGVNSSGGPVSGTEIGRIEYNPGSGGPITTGVLSPLNLSAYGWRIVDLEFSVPFTIDDTMDASMFIGLGTSYIGSAAGASGSKQVIFDFSDNIWYGGSPLKGTFDQGLSLTSITLSDGTPLIDAGFKFDFIPERTILSAFASAADDRGQISPLVDTTLGTADRAAVFPFGGTATSKLKGGSNRSGVPTEALVNLDVNPEPNPFVFDLAGASIGGTGNISLTRIAPGPAPVPEPATILLLGIGLVGLAGIRIRRKKR